MNTQLVSQDTDKNNYRYLDVVCCASDKSQIMLEIYDPLDDDGVTRQNVVVNPEELIEAIQIALKDY